MLSSWKGHLGALSLTQTQNYRKQQTDGQTDKENIHAGHVQTHDKGTDTRTD